MSVTSDTSRFTFDGAGTTGPFTFANTLYNQDALSVILTDANGVDTALELGSDPTDYSVAIASDNSSADITLGTALAVGETLTISRAEPYKQEDVYTEGDKFPAKVTERQLDRAVMLSQQNRDDYARVLRFPITDDPANEMPNATQRAGKVQAYDGDGQPIAAEAVDFTLTQIAAYNIIANQSGGPALPSATPTENIAILAPGASERRTLGQKAYDIINVLDYGVGESDDSAAFQTACERAIFTGRALYIPGGVVVTLNTRVALVNNAALRVCGSGTIKAGADAWSLTTPLVSITGTGDLEIDGVTIDQNWDAYTTPAGHTIDDGARASTWGGASWMFSFLSNQEPQVIIRNCTFIRYFRVFLLGEIGTIIFDCNKSYGAGYYANCVIAVEDALSVTYSNNVCKADLWYTGAPTPGSPGPGTNGGVVTYGIECNKVHILNNTYEGHQLVFHGTVTGSGAFGRELIVQGNTLSEPVADAAFYRWENAAIIGNTVRYSGDMGITVDGSRYTVVSGNVIDSPHVGGISITSAQSVVCCGNTFRDIARAFPEMTYRYASNAGAWLSAISISFQAGASQSRGCIITGNTMHFDNLPPVSDALGTVRAVVLGIYGQETSNLAAYNSAIVANNFVYRDYANLPQCFVQFPIHRFYTDGSSSGTPIPGETFTSGGGITFTFDTWIGAGNLCWVHALSQTTMPAATAFTGALSGATIVSANPLPQLTWLEARNEGNVDWTVSL